MKATALVQGPGQVATPLVVVGFFEYEAGEAPLSGGAKQINDGLHGGIQRLRESGDFHGHAGETLLFYSPPGTIPAQRVLMVGLGARKTVDLHLLRSLGQVAAREAIRLGVKGFAFAPEIKDGGISNIPAEDPARVVTEGVFYESYEFRQSKNDPPGTPPRTETFAMLAGVAHGPHAVAGVWMGTIIGEAENAARTLGDLPPNAATPELLSQRVQALATTHGLAFRDLSGPALAAENLAGLAALATEGGPGARLLVLEYRPAVAATRPVVLIGKGVAGTARAADPASHQKYGKCGGAAALAAVAAAARLGLHVPVVALVPVAPPGAGGRAGDVLPTRAGRTLEVQTPADPWPVLLADTLSFAQTFEPLAIVEASDWGGAPLLGPSVTPVLSSKHKLARALRTAGAEVGQTVGIQALFKEYQAQLTSTVADVKGQLDLLTGGWFMDQFAGGIPWAHLDLTGTAQGPAAGRPGADQATGVPTRLLLAWLRTLAEAPLATASVVPADEAVAAQPAAPAPTGPPVAAAPAANVPLTI